MNSNKKFYDAEERFKNFQFQLDLVGPQISDLKISINDIYNKINKPDNKMDIFWRHMNDMK
jgi:hypothetical protein